MTPIAPSPIASGAKAGAASETADIHSCRDIGRQFGRLTVLSEHPERTKYRGMRWVCQCECGDVRVYVASNVRRGASSSCGCFRREILSAKQTRHGLHAHDLYGVWSGMRDRCNRKSNRKYKYYGGRGISVCAEWDDAGAFIKWGEENGWQPGLQIDRIDNNSGYSPSNCRFVTPAVNCGNRRNTVMHDGIPLADWARAHGVSYWTAIARVKKGRDPGVRYL